MRSVVDIRVSSIKELTANGENEAGIIATFKANPFAGSNAVIGRISGYCGDVEAGREFVFPLLIRTPAGVVEVLAGSNLSVEREYRRTGLGMDLPELRWQNSASKTALGAGLSQMALPVHQLLDYIVFLLPRNIMLWRSRSLIETRIKGVVAKCLSAVVDFGILCYSIALRLCTCLKLKGVRVEEVQVQDKDTIDVVVDLVQADSASFAEFHDSRWFTWVMTKSFSGDGPLRLFVAKIRGEVIGFYMIKKRFHAQASHRGFRNVWLGTVVEWQMKPGFENKLRWMLVDAALKLKREGVDAVEIPSADISLNRFFRRIGWRQVGDGNFVIKAGEGSPLFGNEEMAKIENWRLRPGMGDVPFS